MLLSDGLVPLFWDRQGCLRLENLFLQEIWWSPHTPAIQTSLFFLTWS